MGSPERAPRRAKFGRLGQAIVAPEPVLLPKLRAAADQLRMLPRAYALVRAAAGRWSTAWLALLALQGLVPVAIVCLTQPLVDAIAAAMRAGGTWESTAPVIVPALAMGACLLLAEALRATSEWVGAVQSQRGIDHLSGLIQEKSSQVDLAFYEQPDFHDHLHRARHEARHRPVALLETGGALVQDAITLVAMAVVLLGFGWWISAALLLGTLPALLVVLRFAVRHHRWRRRATPDERRADYRDWLLTSPEAAAELRLFGLAEPARRAYRELRARLRGEELALVASRAGAEAVAAAFALALAGACLAWVLWQAILGAVTPGEAVLFYAAFGQGQRLLRALLSGAGHLYYNVLVLGDLFAFLDLKARVIDRPDPVPAPDPAPGARGLEVRFEAVTFCYPGARAVALRELDLVFSPGRIAALVGANGAGKSTLVKLACRFYDPDAGRVMLGGVDVRDLAAPDLRERISVLFQEPMRYDATVAENIAVGVAQPEVSAVKAAARAAGAEELIARLAHGYETLLGRWFEGGVELSVGEWQRLALARAFCRPAPVILLDEPTSAMDPWAEADWLQRFRSLATGRTAVIVTHRFTTALQADVIHVMDGGRVVESGSHAELVARGGAYSRSWLGQVRAGRIGAAE